MRYSLQPNNFDLLRIFAASQVVLNHTTKHFELSMGAFYDVFIAFPGVPIFFALSGFLISAAWERNPSVTAYVRNRALRIFPGLWVCIVVTIFAFSCYGFDFFSTQGISWALAQAGGMIYTPAFLDGFGFGSYNGSLWTIPIELQFYVLLPALYLLGAGGLRTTRLAAAGFAVFFVVAVLHRTYVPSASGPEPELMVFKLLRYSFIPHVYLFFAGVLMQRLKIHESPIFRGKGLHWLAAYLLLVGIAPQIPLVEIVKLLMLAVVAVSLAYTAPDTSAKILGRTDISYGVYIYHGLLINVFVQSGLVGQWNYAAWLFLLTGLAGYLSWILVEKPCMLHKRRGRSAAGKAHRGRSQPAHMTTM